MKVKGIGRWTAEMMLSIPMVTPEQAYGLAQDTVKRGITRIKIKVGGDLREDADQGYTPSQALLCLEALDDHDIRPLLQEQLVHKDDYEGLHKK